MYCNGITSWATLGNKITQEVTNSTIILAHVLFLITITFFLQTKKYVSSDEVGNGTEPQDGSRTNKHERMSTGKVVITRKETIT